MLIKVISLPFNSALGGFNDNEVRDFLKDKELISVQDYLFIKNDVPYLTFVLKYFPHRAEVESGASASQQKDKRDDSWREGLSEADMGLFNLLRDWRSQRSKKDGMPPYILFTNQQLAAIAKKRPQTPTQLMQIDGIGQGKAQKYGDDILALSRTSASSSESGTESGAGATVNEKGNEEAVDGSSV